jgi:hypothetical protein
VHKSNAKRAVVLGHESLLVSGATLRWVSGPGSCPSLGFD